jgi:phage tail-like protein
MWPDVDSPTAHALLRDRQHWIGTLSGVDAGRDGDLTLARVPGPGDGKSIRVAATLPYQREVSGIAAGPCGAVFISDTRHKRVLYRDLRCGADVWLPAGSQTPADVPGHFNAPRGLALAHDALLVADSGHDRVQLLAFPGLEPHLVYGPWPSVSAIAVDGKGRLLIVDHAANRVRRMTAGGIADAPFDNDIFATGVLQRPLFVACDAVNRVLVSDADANQVFIFDEDGRSPLTLPGPPAWLPGAVAAFARRVYVADAASGAIWVFDGDRLSGAVHGWKGPVTALATDDQGGLLIKPALDITYYHFPAGAAHVPSGQVAAGPFDAGEDRDWVRAWVDVDLPPGTAAAVFAATGAALSPAPLAAQWHVLPSTDALLPGADGARRFVWLRIELTTTVVSRSPRLIQARVATAAENLRDYLPLAYSLADRDSGVLDRWLQLLQGEFARVEEWLDDMPRVADPAFASAAALEWLADWLAFELPSIADDAERRSLLLRAAQLLERRGTAPSLAEFVELHTGIRPVIHEAFEDRRVWMLGLTSQLGFDTRLACLDPEGMVVPDTTVPDPIGRVIVGESGPLAAHQVGLPLFAEEAYRFCVLVDGYRAGDPAIRAEISRIVDREKPAHTDYRIEYLSPETRVGLQARVGVDMIVGGNPPSFQLGPAHLGTESRLPPADVSRVGSTHLDGTLTLS